MDDETIMVMMIMMVMVTDDEILLVESYTGVMLYQLRMLWSVLKAKPKIHIPLQTCSQSCQGSHL